MSTALRADEHWYHQTSSGNEIARTAIKPVVISRPQLSAPTVVHYSKWAKTTVERLVALAPLKDNWDQRGSAAVRGDVLEFAWNLLAQIMPNDGKPPVVVPIGRGGIQLEWSCDAVDFEIEVSRPFEISALLVTSVGGEETIVELPTENWDRLTEIVRKHFRQ